MGSCHRFHNCFSSEEKKLLLLYSSEFYEVVFSFVVIGSVSSVNFIFLACEYCNVNVVTVKNLGVRKMIKNLKSK